MYVAKRTRYSVTVKSSLFPLGTTNYYDDKGEALEFYDMAIEYPQNYEVTFTKHKTIYQKKLNEEESYNRKK